MTDAHTSNDTSKQERAKELRSHLGHLDALRGIAVLGIVLVHVGLQFPSALGPITFSGQRGVQLFFMVSAFTLFLSSDKRKEESRPMLAFFLRRFFRLAPLYYPCILLTRIYFPVVPHSTVQTVLAFTFLHNVSSRTYWAGAYGGWSLGVEALFYACFPVLFLCVRSLRSAIIWIVIAAPASVALWHVFLRRDPSNWGYWTFGWFPTQFPVFLMGVVVYFLWKERLRSLSSTPSGTWLSLGLLFCAAGVYLGTFNLRPEQLLLSSTEGALLLAALSLRPWKFLVNRFTIFMGKISYSVYLLHDFVLSFIYPWVGAHLGIQVSSTHHQLAHMIAAFLSVLAGSIVVSTLTWFLVEEPGIRLGRRVIQKLQGGKLNRHAADLLAPVQAITAVGNSPDAQF